MPTVEEYFDDETDLPLPSGSSSSKPQARGLPNTGARGALLEQIGDDDDEMDFSKLADQSRGVFGENSQAPPPRPTGAGNGKGKMTMREDPGEVRPTNAGAQGGGGGMNPNTAMGGFMGDMMKLQQVEEERMEKLRRQFGNVGTADPSVYKTWNTIYPLYFDAKVSVSDGRRVKREEAVWWPQGTQISRACKALGLPSVLEPDRCHPADWENPGRVKVQFLRDGRYLNPIVKNRTQLYKHIASQIQQQNPEIVYTKPKRKAPIASAAATSTKTSNKQHKRTHKKAPAASAPVVVKVIPPSRPDPPPQPVPALEDRLPLHSPVHPAGVAVASIKRDLETEKENKKKGIPAGGEVGSGGQPKQLKMKRMVVRGKR